MGVLLNEFDFLLENEEETTYEEDSIAYIKQAEEFIKKSKKYSDRTYQGISVGNICKCITIGKTEMIPWEHTCFTIDFNILRDITNSKLEELSIPPFIEEVKCTDEQGSKDIGFVRFFQNNIKYIKIPKSVILLSPNIFAYYTKLEKITFEEGSKLIYLGDNAFASCEKLHTLDLRNCKQLDEIKKNTFINSGLCSLKITQAIQKMYPIQLDTLKNIIIDNEVYTKQEFNNRLNEIGATGEVFWATLNDYNF